MMTQALGDPGIAARVEMAVGAREVDRAVGNVERRGFPAREQPQVFHEVDPGDVSLPGFTSNPSAPEVARVLVVLAGRQVEEYKRGVLLRGEAAIEASKSSTTLAPARCAIIRLSPPCPEIGLRPCPRFYSPLKSQC